MKKNFLFLAALAFLLITSCTDNSLFNGDEANIQKLPSVTLTEDEIVSIAFDNVEELTSENVLTIFKSFVEAKEEKSVETRSMDLNSPIKIRSKYYVHKNTDNVVETTSNPTVKTRSGDESVMEAPIYELEVENGTRKTFALVSGDPRTPKVLAFLPDADEETYNNINTQIMLAMSKATVIDEIQKIENTKKNLRKQTLEKLAAKWGVEPSSIVYDQIINSIVSEKKKSATRGYQDGSFVDDSNVKDIKEFANIQINSFVAPMGKIAWNQEKPYNRALPNDYVYMGGTPTMSKRIAGCGVIAIAEALAMVKPTGYFDGIRMDWDLINAQEKCIENPIIPGLPSNNTPEATLNMVGRFIKSIYYDSYTEAEYVTDPKTGLRVNTGSTTNAGNIIKYLRSKIQCNDARTWDPDICKASLDGIRPVMVYGNIRVTYYNYPGAETQAVAGHGYNIDGYLITEKVTRQLVQTNDVYWHASLGWGPASRGYYKLSLDTKCNIIVDNSAMKVRINIGEAGNVTINGQSYDLTQYMITNLHK